MPEKKSGSVNQPNSLRGAKQSVDALSRQFSPYIFDKTEKDIWFIKLFEQRQPSLLGL